MHGETIKKINALLFTFTFVSLRCIVSRICGCARSMQLLSVSLIHGAQFENIQNSNVNTSNKPITFIVRLMHSSRTIKVIDYNNAR